MKKSELVSQIGEISGITASDIRLVLNALADAVAINLKECGVGDKVVVPGIVTLKCKFIPAKKAHPGRNPMTGEPIMVAAKPAHWKVRATVAKPLKEAITKRRR